MSKFGIEVSEFYCKGCGLCIDACPQHIMALDQSTVSAKGYHVAHCNDSAACTGCKSCVAMCPDVAITITKTD